ncbi:hypothetical protein [Pelomicrobium sp. G1]|uniref:hypothetical protein n=1 Tax=unclassified Pelomicrobium TaxID=2815318 RepID=UPI003F76742A
MIETTALGAGAERAWIEELTPEVLVDPVARFVQVHADFFVRRVMPALETATSRIAAAIGSGGTHGSPGSSGPASATGT